MSKIEWTEQTWNPIVGCSIVSPGCTNCYAMKMAARLEAMGVPHYAGLTQSSKAGAVWTGKMALAPEKILLEPLRRRKPTMYFVNSMGDLFHEDVPDEWIDRVFAVMALCPQHTFQVLTKRSARMREYMQTWGATGWTSQRKYRVGDQIKTIAPPMDAVTAIGRLVDAPLPNVWLGVSAERQKEADERIPDLLATPAAVRFVSAEPLLGPIDFTSIPTACLAAPSACCRDQAKLDALRGIQWCQRAGAYGYPKKDHLPQGLNWLIVGGESGPGARPMHPDWARSIRDQCAAAGVPFFFKQWGSWGVTYDRDQEDPDWRRCDTVANNSPRGQWLNLAGGQGFHGERVVRVEPMNKTRPAGRLLDGREHNDMPNSKVVEAA